jgi:hypothetical protein
MRCSPSEVVIRAGHPVARSGVTAEPASPHGVVRPFSVLSAGEVAAYWFTAVSFDLEPSRDLVLGVFPHRPRPKSFPSMGHIHSWVFTLLQGVTGANPSTASPFTRSAQDRYCPSLGVHIPTAVASTKGSVTPMASTPPAPCVLRVLRPHDALLPFEPSDGCPPGRSWDSAFRALLLPVVTAPFRACPEPS